MPTDDDTLITAEVNSENTLTTTVSVLTGIVSANSPQRFYHGHSCVQASAFLLPPVQYGRIFVESIESDNIIDDVPLNYEVSEPHRERVAKRTVNIPIKSIVEKFVNMPFVVKCKEGIKYFFSMKKSEK